MSTVCTATPGLNTLGNASVERVCPTMEARPPSRGRPPPIGAWTWIKPGVVAHRALMAIPLPGIHKK